MKKTLLLLTMVVVALFVASCSEPYGNSGGTAPSDDSYNSQSSKGEGVFIIKDAAANMGSVTELWVTIESVRVHSAAQGWVEVSSNAKKYDLLDLKERGSGALFAQVELDPGLYDQMRLEVSEVTVVDAQGEHKAKLPSGEIKMNGQLEIRSNTTSTATFDFIADESLHMAGNGQYILAPVVKVETRTDASVQKQDDDFVEVNGGTVRSNFKVGMDEKGNVGVGIMIPANTRIDINGDMITIYGGVGVIANQSRRGNSQSNRANPMDADAQANVDVGASY